MLPFMNSAINSFILLPCSGGLPWHGPRHVMRPCMYLRGTWRAFHIEDMASERCTALGGVLRLCVRAADGHMGADACCPSAKLYTLVIARAGCGRCGAGPLSYVFTSRFPPHM